MRRRFTKKELADALSPKGAYNKKQLAYVGIGYPLARGWFDILKNNEFNEETIRGFIGLRTKGKHYEGYSTILKEKVGYAIDNDNERIYIPCTGNNDFKDCVKLLRKLNKQELKEIVAICVEFIG